MLPTAFRLAVIGLDLEADPEEAEENERLVFSLASCFFALDSFASPDAASDESCSGGRPFAWIGKKEGEGVVKLLNFRIPEMSELMLPPKLTFALLVLNFL